VYVCLSTCLPICLPTSIQILTDLATHLITPCNPAYLPIYLTVCLSASLPAFLSICVSSHLSVYLSTYPSIHPFIFPSIHPPIHPSIHLSIYLPMYLPSYLSIYLSIHLSVCLPTYLPAYLPTFLPTCLPTCLFYITSLFNLCCLDLMLICWCFFCSSTCPPSLCVCHWISRHRGRNLSAVRRCFQHPETQVHFTPLLTPLCPLTWRSCSCLKTQANICLCVVMGWCLLAGFIDSVFVRSLCKVVLSGLLAFPSGKCFYRVFFEACASYKSFFKGRSIGLVCGSYLRSFSWVFLQVLFAGLFMGLPLVSSWQVFLEFFTWPWVVSSGPFGRLFLWSVS